MRLGLEILEARNLLSARLILGGPQTLVPSGEINVSHNPAALESEMTIAVNPANPLNVAGFVHEALLLHEIQVFFTLDGGRTWTRESIGPIGTVNNDGQGPGIRFDPTIKFTSTGDLFIAYGVFTGATTRLVVGKSTDGGNSFANNSFRVVDTQSALGGVDKFLLGVGPSSSAPNAPAAVYVSYERNDGGQPIVVAGSNDGGNSFTTPLILDTFGRGSYFAGPAVGPHGELYVAWLSTYDGKIKMRVKPDGLWGTQSWGPTTIVENLHASLAQFQVPAQPRRGIYNNPSIDVDRSGGPNNGRVYVAYTDRVSGNNTDIFLTYSDNSGATWSPVGSTGNVENSPGTEFHSWVAVDQLVGTVNVLYRTTDGGDANNNTVVTRVATSLDGGQTFPNRIDLSTRRSRAASVASVSEFLDYDGLDVLGGVIHGFWSDNRGANPGIYVTDLDAYYAQAALQSTKGSNTLMVGVADTGQPNNTIIVRTSSVRSDYLEVLINGRVQYAGTKISVNAVQINAQTGNNTIRVEPLASDISVTVAGGNGNNTLVGPNSDNTWAITGPNTGSLTTAKFTVNFTSIQNLLGGTGADTFQFYSGGSVGSMSGTIDGGGGNGSNLLDYSNYHLSVEVNLRTRTATGVGGSLTHIQNVMGGTGGSLTSYNIIVGNGGNFLSGGAGRRSLLIAGPSHSSLQGGDRQEDILIGGTTQWDTNPAALESIMATWTRTLVSFQDRAALIQQGDNTFRFVLNSSTVSSNSGGNRLIGGDMGQDLYFGDLLLDTYDLRHTPGIFVSLRPLGQGQGIPLN